MNNQMTVRAATRQDAADIARLFVQLGYGADAATVLARLEAADAQTAVLVTEDAGAVSGVLAMHVFAPLHVPDPWAVISALVVDERSRSGGAGALLVAAAEAQAHKLSCGHLELSCSDTRTRAHAFYESQGFIEKRKRFYKPLR